MAVKSRAEGQNAPPEKRLSNLPLYLGFIPVLLLIVLIPAISLFLEGHPLARLIVDPPLLRPIVNTVCVILAACVVAYIAMRSYLLGGSSTVLLLGCGTLVLGSGSFVASWLLRHAGPNAYMTVVNLSAMLSSVFHVAGAIANVKESPPEADVTHRRDKLVAGYVGVLVLVALASLATVTGIMPPFFIQGAGPTNLRQTVLMVALILFIITSTSMMIRFIQEKARFLYWYSMALALLALSVGGAFFQPAALGSLMGLLARIPLYLSGIYFFMAIISASQEARTQKVSLNESIAELFRKSEHKISFILSSITDGYYELDRDWRFVRINDRALSYFGRKREDVIGQLHRDVFPTIKGSIFEERYRKVFSDGDSVQFEAQSVLLPGKWVQTHAYPTEEGGISVFFRDITERKKAEEALRESEERFRLSMEATDDGLWDWNIKTDEAYFSPAYFRMLGYELGGFHGKGNSWKELIHPDDREHALRANLDCIEGRSEFFEVEFRMKAKNGEWRWILGRGKCVARDEQGRALRLVGTHVDITERKQAEEALKRSEEAALRLAQETAVIAEIGRIISSSLDIEEIYEHFAEKVRKLVPFDRIVVNLVNTQEGTVTITYVSGAEIEGREKRDVFPLAGATIEEMVRTKAPILSYTESVEEIRTPGLVLALEAGLRSRLLVPLSARGEVIGALSLWSKQLRAYGERDVRLAQSVANQIAGAIANAQLFHECKRVEEELRASLREKEVLLQEIHHRVKNNLQIISSLLYLQSTRTEHPEAISALQESRDRVKSMALIHERLYQSPNLASIDVGGYVRSLVSDLRRSYITEDSSVRLTVNVGDIPLGITEAIPCGLIINELVSNALKHAFPKGRDGEITIQLQRAGANQIALTVSDNGVGLPEHVDFRKSPSLGLTLVNAMVGQLEGTIELDRSKGTAFTIRFG